MKGKKFSIGGTKFLIVSGVFALVAAPVRAQGSAPLHGAHPPLLGSASCAASGCHGGAGDKSCQVVIWSQRDVHSRSYATLTTSRAARMAEALKIPDATTSARCTTCHAPLATVTPAMLAPDEPVTEGVSCGSCHGAAESWLRSHTRPDFTRADRTAAGLRDLHDLANRAGSCVACHQNIEPALVNTGKHPALIFELDGQTQSEPKHWKEPADRSGAQAWFVGQAVALREVSWALVNQRADPTRDGGNVQALTWLLQRTGLTYDLPAVGQLNGQASATTTDTADQLARRAAQTWSADNASVILGRLAATSADFRATDKPALAHAVRAERLVLALDRLLAALPVERRPASASAQLDKLFRLAQSQPDFVPADFARELAAFAQTFGKS